MAETKRWLVFGCLGCLGVVGLIVVAAAITSGVAMLQVKQEEVERHVATRDVPAVADTGSATVHEIAPPADVGHVLLELARGEFEIETVDADEPLRVDARYDKKSYELIETLERTEGEGWTYHVSFTSTVPNFMLGLRQLFGGSQPEIRIFLPLDTPMSLVANLSQGGARVDLGGLWLTELDLRLNQGGFQIDIDEPLRQPLERMTIQGSMGGMQISRVGNASPRRLEAEFGMGGLELDLRGNWITDSDISISTGMGGTILRLPRDVTIEGLNSAGFRAPEETETPRPTLRFSTSTSMGEMEIIP